VLLARRVHGWALPFVSALLIAVALVCGTASAASAATFTVTNQNDEVDVVPGDGNCVSTPSGVCTLRAAIMEANALAGADSIVVQAGTYVLTRSGNDANDGSAGDLDINSDVTIIGAGARTTIIDGDGALSEDRVSTLAPCSPPMCRSQV
jgi:hypothetical protein